MRLKKNTYTADEVRQIIEQLMDDDSLVMYSAKEVQQIFRFKSIDSARRLLNHPALTVMQIGRSKLVTKKELKKFIDFNAGSYVDLY